MTLYDVNGAAIAVHPPYDWSGRKFGVPDPVFLTKSWRVKHGWRDPETLTAQVDSVTTTLAGEDSINAAACSKGLPVYCGYYNGTFANLNAFRSLYPSAIILSITPDGVKGARCIDCEPGDATVAEAADFVAANLPTAGAGGRNDGGLPMVYTSAGDAQAVINAVAAKGIARSQWVLWSAHWIGEHICSPAGCGYPQADGTQYASNNSYDSDLFYSYCFGTVSPWPLGVGSTGPLVTSLQQNINKCVNALAGALGIPPLVVDGDFGTITEAAVAVAQVYFNNGGVRGTCDQALYNSLAANPAPPPPPPSWPLTAGDTGPLVRTLQGNLVKWKFASADPAVFPIDGNFGSLTRTAVVNAQAHFKNGAQLGTCDQALFNDLAAAPPAPPDPPFAYEPVTGLKLLGAGPHSVKFEFTAPAQPHAGLAKFEVVVSKGDTLTTDISGYPRYIGFGKPGLYEEQYGDVQPTTGYTMGVRGMAQDGSHSSKWVLLHFQTAPA